MCVCVNVGGLGVRSSWVLVLDGEFGVLTIVIGSRARGTSDTEAQQSLRGRCSTVSQVS